MLMRTGAAKACAGTQMDFDDSDVYYNTAVIISKTPARPTSKYEMPSQRGILLTFLFCHVPPKCGGTCLYREGGVCGFGQKRTLQFLMFSVHYLVESD